MPGDIPITPEMVEAALDEWNTTVHLPTQRDSMHAALSAAFAASALPRVVEAAEEFVRRVENREVRSVRTYAAFKAALSALKGGGDA